MSNRATKRLKAWTFQITTTTANEAFRLFVTATSMKVIVDWGDGEFIDWNNPLTIAHVYVTAGTYTLRLRGWVVASGGLGRVYFYHGSYPTNGSRVTKILSPLRGISGITTMRTMFRGCTNLTKIPSDLFRYLPNIAPDAFYQAFYDCTGLTSIPTDIFRYNTLASTNGFYETFRGCTGLTSLPTDLFRYNTAASTSVFYGTFYGCTGLTSLPTDLFRYNTSVGASGFQATFQGCTGITSVSSDLFKYNTAVSSAGFSSTFYGCTGLTSIPTDLFRYNTSVSSSGFNATFRGCTGLTSLPTDLFRYNTAVSTNGFGNTFYGCTGLTSLPTDLFRYNTSCTGFNNCFYGCSALQLRADIFFPTGGESTRFLNQSINFTNCFYLTSFSGTQGTAPALWDCSFGTGTPTKTDCFQGHSTSTIDNYASIPADWL